MNASARSSVWLRQNAFWLPVVSLAAAAASSVQLVGGVTPAAVSMSVLYAMPRVLPSFG